MSTQPNARLTPEQYLEIERKAQFKSEFYDGEMFAMAGASFAHGKIVSNINAVLTPALRGRCTTITNDLRVVVGRTGLYTYPDIVVTCQDPKFIDGALDTLTNPTILMEVLSPSTESYDRGKKFEQYRKVESLREYLLVWVDRPHIECFTRVGDKWTLSEVDGVETGLQLESINFTLLLRDVYADLKF
jgi:Uma2 family endonuclease